LQADDDSSAALDGNAIAGLLVDVFGTELTTAVGECASCGTQGPLAETVVSPRSPGTVVRCRTCHEVLMVLVTVRDLGAGGVTAATIDSPSPQLPALSGWPRASILRLYRWTPTATWCP